jgi:hypothetical protein
MTESSQAVTLRLKIVQADADDADLENLAQELSVILAEQGFVDKPNTTSETKGFDVVEFVQYTYQNYQANKDFLDHLIVAAIGAIQLLQSRWNKTKASKLKAELKVDDKPVKLPDRTLQEDEIKEIAKIAIEDFVKNYPEVAAKVGPQSNTEVTIKPIARSRKNKKR